MRHELSVNGVIRAILPWHYSQRPVKRAIRRIEGKMKRRGVFRADWTRTKHGQLGPTPVACRDIA